MRELRRKVLIPVFQVSEITVESDPRAIRRDIKEGMGREALSYFLRFAIEAESHTGFNYNLFPVVLDRYSVPWHLGTLHILSKLEAEPNPNMTTFQSRADDLGAYKEWLDQHDNPDELLFDFPKLKLRRPTYRYRGFIQQQIYAQEISPSTAKRRMSTVVSFYRWLIENKFFEPEHPPWEERTFQLVFKNTAGFSVSKPVTSTDVAIRTPKSEDPFEGTIQDGGKLRPLTEDEQQGVVEAADALGNTEMYLIQLFMLLTGARIQTACTLRVRHFTQEVVKFSKALGGDGEVFKLKAGPGTGIDTKGDKNGVLQVPRALYEALHTYALSARARRRREKASGGDHANQYLFLTQQGSPYYLAKAEALRFDPDLERRHRKVGGTVRQFIKDHMIPYIQQRHDPNFHYRIHDLRASFGMNMTDIQLSLVEKGIITLHKARMNVKDLMWHESSATTDRYIDHRKQMEAVYAAINGYGEQVQAWIQGAMKALDDNE